MSVGVKYDGNKPRWSLLPTGILWAAVAVMEHGAKKYSLNNWMHVPNGVERYTDAAARHLAALECGEDTDDDSGLSHVGHYLCSAIFAAWHMAHRAEALRAWRERGSVGVPVDPRQGPKADPELIAMCQRVAERVPETQLNHEHVFELCDQGTSTVRTWVCLCGDKITHELGTHVYKRHFKAGGVDCYNTYFSATRA